MDDDQPSLEAEPPIGMAALACLICLAAAALAMSLLLPAVNFWWVKGFAYLLAPMAMAFCILYRSEWHRELARGTRILSMLLSAGIIFCVDIGIIVAVITTACLFMGITRFH